MYEQHFGFNRRPFRAIATGADVFVGPQTAKIMQAMRMALGTPDAVIAVMGAPGTGKTTIVNRALDAIEGDKHIIRFARMQLGHDEVLDFLLDEMQAQSVPASTIRKVTLFRRLLAERTAAGVRVVVVLEDAIRIGDDALAEIEALTAADGVGTEGAALVIMGEPELRERLDSDALTRLKQRIRAYQFVNPLVAPELQGYLKHCFRLGGGEFDQLFEAQGAAFVHALTDGVPRTANNLVEAVLNAAAARKLPRVDNRFVASVAQSEFGLTAPLPEPVKPPAAPPQPEVPSQPEAQATPAASPSTTRDSHVDTVPDVSAAAPRPSPEPEIDARPAAPVALAAAEEPGAAPASATADDDVPELINDTLPDLEVLAPELTHDSDDAPTTRPVVTNPEEPPAVSDDPVDDERIPTLASTSTNPVLDAAPQPAPVSATPPAAGKESVPKPQPEQPAVKEAVPELQLESDTTSDAVPELQLDTATKPQPPKAPVTKPQAVSKPKPAAAPVAKPVASPKAKSAADVEPTPEKAAKAEAAAAAEPQPVAELQLEEAVAANEEQQAQPEGAQQPAPDALRDPTLAELKPDFDVLEEAMAGLTAEDAPAEVPEAVVEEEEVRDPTQPSLPTITLDAAIKENIAEATAALEKHDATIADDTVSEENSEIAAAAPKKPAADGMSDTDIKKIASGIRKAKSLEDVDEKMAETLFGAEFSAIAAQVIANPPPSDTASQPQLDVSADTPPEVPDEEQLMQELSLVEDSLASDPKSAAAKPGDAPVLDKPTTEMEKEFLEVYGENALEVSIESDKPNPGMDLSASQRLATVRALNAEQVPKAALPPKPAPKSAANQDSPQSIEDQITTSMTATLKALSVRPDSANDEDDDEEETPKRGFFSRFRRS